jgi:glycosyltransferase involved in cell wall biosynthesis
MGKGVRPFLSVLSKKIKMPKSKKLLLIGGSKGNVHLLNYYKLISGYFDDILVVSDFEFEACPSASIQFEFKSPISLLQNVRALRKIIEAFKPSIIHVHQANAYGLVTCLANQKKTPIVLTTWGSDVLTLPHKSFLHRWMVKFILKSAQQITADAGYMGAAIEQLIGKTEVIIANFGVELSAVELSAERAPLIYSNRMHEPLYQIDQIIIQAAPFLSEHPGWILNLAASGSQTAGLKELAQEKLPNGSYHFLGFQAGADNQRNYLAAKFYVSIPTTDGTSISLLEAMAYGCIPIVSDLPANREWIDHGKNGLITSGDLSKDLALAQTLDVYKVQQLNKLIISQKATKAVNQSKFIAMYNRILA